MDERLFSDDTSAIRGSLVDSRRLLFEKIVTEQANVPEAANCTTEVARRNGRLPRSVRAGKVISFRDKIESSSPVDADLLAANSSEATAVRRHSHNDEFPTNNQPGADNERASPVPSSEAAANADESLLLLPSSPSCQTAAVAPSEISPPSEEITSQVPHNECHSYTSELLSSRSASPVTTVLCQSNGDISPPYSKRISYTQAVLNGIKPKRDEPLKLPDTVLETSCSSSPLSDGGIKDDNFDNSSASENLHVDDCKSPSSIAVAASPRLTPVKDLGASSEDCQNSLNSSGCNSSKPSASGTVDDEPAEIYKSDIPSLASDSVKSSQMIDSDELTRLADDNKPTPSAVPATSCVLSVEKKESDLPVSISEPTKPPLRSKHIQPVEVNKPIRSSSPVTVPSTIVTEYPDELNPFSDDEDDDEKDKSRKTLEMSRADVGSEYSSTNPFGSDSEDEDIIESKSTPTCTNPFGNDSEEDDDEPSPRTPVPLPRTVRKPPANSSPQPSPRPRPRDRTGYSSSEISPTSSCRKSSADSAEFHLSSNSIHLTPRKKKPAPPPPPLQKNGSDSNPNSRIEPTGNSNDQTKMKEFAKIYSGDSHITGLDDGAKKVVSPWKNKKRPAPARPTPQRRPVKEMPLEDIKVELEDIEIRYQELVRQATQMEEKIHTRTQLESAESSAVEEMVVQLFELVNEKNELFRRRSELVNMRKMHSLEVEQADIEYQIRCLMLRPESNKTDTDKANEEALVKRLVEIVEKRNEIIDLMDKDRLRETVEDESVTAQLEPKMNGCEKKSHKSKEKKKKSKKDKNKEPEDGDKHSPSKLIMQKFMTLRHTAKKLHPKLPD